MTDADNLPRPRNGRVLPILLRRALPIFVLLIVLAGLFLFFEEGGGAPQPETAAETARPLPVSVVTVEREDFAVRRRFLGRTQASKEVEIRARVPGYLHARTFEEGSFVELGQPLFQIDPRPFENELARAKAHLLSAKATLARAAQQAARYRELRDRQSATAGELEEWQRQEAVAAADVELAKVEIAAAELNLEYTKIVAPVSGMIGEALKEEGSYVDAGSNGLMAVIQQVDPIDVRFSLTEKQLLRWRAQIERGVVTAPPLDRTEVSVTLADGTVLEQRGRVDYIAPELATTTGTAQLRARVPNGDRALKPGQFVHVELLGVRRVHALRVPQDAVLMSPSGASVYVVGADGRVEARPVELGEWSDDNTWIVESGLLHGDRVVVNRLLMLRPGTPVHATAP